MRITADQVEAALGLDPEDGPYLNLRKADAVHHSVGNLMLSLWEQAGAPLSPAATATLARQRARVARYDECESRIRAAGIDFRVVKGRTIGDLYPAGVLRAQTDLDLVVGSVDDLWTAALLLVDDLGFDSVDLTVVEGTERELYVALSAPAEDEYYDKPLSVELSTVLYYGDSDTVPLRRGVPADQVVANVLALSEERFQRPFHVRDVLDLGVLCDQLTPERRASLLAAVESYRLAPELVELVELARAHGIAATLDDELVDLRDAAEREAARRRTTAARGDEGLGLSFGILVPGSRLRSGWSVERSQMAGTDVLVTPLGTFVLTSNAVLSPETFDAVQAAVAQLVADELDAGGSAT
ncbi:nucleotidyltransferase family protein [Cellulomonas sp. Leaf334]|uniref:nucleotidyltransferase family protein n=1 Tax=Cellulomonas sp. Leaf334 TaxID=1736339 RepID=UPI000712AFFD|nr:nucleotidyltransferase family protein [Cellulomonas sp. Leaf334]KQR11672.1 hypothetical protein ASF78_10530 [Cellulomonas sp. Leaf334]